MPLQIGKGAASWEGWAGDHEQPGAEDDNGVHLIKSGTDFRDLSTATLALSPTPRGSVRKYLVDSLTGKHHYILPSSPSSPDIDKLVSSLLSSVSSTLQKPVCFSLTELDARSEVIRTKETALGNLVADIVLHAYSESLMEKSEPRGEADLPNTTEQDQQVAESVQKSDFIEKGGKRPAGGRADAVMLVGGTFRSDNSFGPGKITLGDIMGGLPLMRYANSRNLSVRRSNRVH